MIIFIIYLLFKYFLIKVVLINFVYLLNIFYLINNSVKKLRTMLIGFCVFGYGIATQAQEAVSAAGGNASGSGGTASYTIGQVAYTTNSSASGTITQGVQQPYEILCCNRH